MNLLLMILFYLLVYLQSYIANTMELTSAFYRALFFIGSCVLGVYMWYLSTRMKK